ncbi:MAG: hypothetical protein KDA28_16855 [Phycisphaerales bacterium]|nr:hypothetical protein [Phycisphaerales bacterium]
MTPEVTRLLIDSPILVVAMIGVVIIVSMLIKTAGATIAGVARERTKREIAAYIAEGAMTPEQGERLINSNRPTQI